MSPCNLGIASQSTCFPRVSGDEPADAEALKQFITFSPRERG